MQADPPQHDAAGGHPRRLFYYSGGFLRERRLRRILDLAGYKLSLGLPSRSDAVVVWGRSPYARRGEAIAKRFDVPLLRLEDAFLRSVRPGRAGDAPLGLLIDPIGVHFDGSRPSHLEVILNTYDLDNSDLLARADAGISQIKAFDLSKYNIHLPFLPCPASGYVLVIDQTKGDASLRFSSASDGVFERMLATAQREHPGKRIVVKSHPETNLNLRGGHFGPSEAYDLITMPVSPWKLLAGAVAVYTVSSQLGFEAILAGHRPRVFGQPFYAGWGLSDDEIQIPRRHRSLTARQLFAGAMILAPTWYDPCRDRLCSFEEVVTQLEAEARAFREDHAGHIAVGMRLWKRGWLQKTFGRFKVLLFIDDAEKAANCANKSGKSLLVWAGKEPSTLPNLSGPLYRVEDGFLRSRGLGAELVPPLSLITDDLGVYYDPSRESRLERLILSLPPEGGEARARRLVDIIVQNGLSKYNLGGADLPYLPKGRSILIPGQVEDDASIKLGAGKVRTNLALVQAVKSANPDAVLIYKPHPDVEAGLRPGMIDPALLEALVDQVANHADPITLLDRVDEVWTMTSLIGFEALLRGKAVTCLGTPFYAGWGLTADLGPIPQRRLQSPDGTPLPRLSLEHLAYATLIAYPRYFDPVSKLACPPEVVLDRLRSGRIPRPSATNRILAKFQGKLASYATLWR